MYKTLSRNMLSRRFRGKAGASTKRFSLKQTGKIIAAKRAKSRERRMQTEPELIPMLGEGPAFVIKTHRKFQRAFAEQEYDPKRCSAFLNLVAKSRMIDGSLWSDKAVESMFRRIRLADRKK